MKLNITALLIFGSTFTAFAQKNDLQERELNGRVKTIRETRYEPVISGEKIKKGKQSLCEDFLVSQPYFLFNDKGFITGHTEYGPDNKVVYKETYEMNPAGRSTSSAKYDAHGKLISSREYDYNARNQLIKATEFAADKKKISELTYFYNNDKQLTEQKSANFATNQNSLYTARYENGQLIEEMLDGYVKFKVKNKFDEKGNIYESAYYSLTDTLEYTISKKYDEHGNMTEYHYTDGNLFTMDKSYQYEYDENGNWTKRILFEDKKPKCIAQRKITYYK